MKFLKDRLITLARKDLDLRTDRLSIGGMRCSACVQLIELRMRQLVGLNQFKLNALTQKMDVTWDPHVLSLRDIVERVTELGYTAIPSGQKNEGMAWEHKIQLWRLFVAAFAMMQVMMYAFPAYLVPVPQIDGELTPDIDHLLKWASLVMTLPVLLFSAWPFFRSAWRDCQQRHVGMDVPVSLGMIVTFIASVWNTYTGGPVYYDSLIMFVLLLLVARWIESRVQKKSVDALHELTQLVPLTVQKLIQFPESRQTKSVDVSMLCVGDHILIPAGAQIPVDGITVEGASQCDEALMTGESRAVDKQVGSSLLGGTLNLSAPLVMRAERVGDATELSALVRMMERAAIEKPSIVKLADRYASYFLSGILLLALITGAVWWQIDATRALWVMVTLIVVTCPCALSLATPAVMAATIGQLAKKGVLVARGQAIEKLAMVDCFVFDKTGTLTDGRLNLVDEQIWRSDTQPDLNLVRAVLLDMVTHSLHPVSRALSSALSPAVPFISDEVFRCDRIEEIPGQGMEAWYQDRCYRLGRFEFVQKLHGQSIEVPARFSGKTLVSFGDRDGWIALYALEDRVRSDAEQLICFLRESNKKVCLLSGDREEVVNQVAQLLGIEIKYSGLTPERKYQIVKQWQREGMTVAMIGDGINDGPVLSLADVSIAMGQGAPISQIRSDLVLMSNRLGDMRYSIQMTTLARKLIRQNLIWAVAYNAIVIPVAALGMLSPWYAAAGMSLSSLFVVVNSLRAFAQK